MTLYQKVVLCVVILALLTMTHRLYAQRWQTTTDERQTQPLTLHGSLLLQGVYPGFRIGLERPISQTDFSRRSGRTFRRERAVLFYAGMYYHPGFHLNTFVGSEYVFRRVGHRGFVREFRTSLALSRTFLGATTYEVSDAGTVSTVSGGTAFRAGQFYAMPGLGFGIGKDFSRTNGNGRPLALMLNLNLTGLLPYNGLVLPTPMLELGFRYRFAGLPTAQFRHKTKKRA